MVWAALCEVRPIDAGLRCVDEEGQLRWERVHHSLIPHHLEVNAEGLAAVGEVPFLVQEERVLLAVGGDLLEVERATGQVVGRTRYPGSIEGMAQEGDEVTVRLIWRSPWGILTPVEVVYRGPRGMAGQALWGDPRATHFSAWYDARRILQTRAHDDEAGQVEALRRAARRDQTNPFYYLVLGDQVGEQVYQDALGLPGVLWMDWLILWTELEHRGRPDEARRAFALAREGMAAEGVRPERFLGVDPLSTLSFLHPSGTVWHAMDEGDADRVDELSSRIAELFPLMQGGAELFGALGDWFLEQGREDLAATWGDRAERAREGSPLDLRPEVEAANRLSMLVLTLFYTLLVSGFVLGLRSGRRREGARWLPKPVLGDLGMPLVFFVALIPLTLLMATTMASFNQKFFAPTGLQADGLAAPDVEEWLQEREPSTARDALLAIAAEERGAFLRGEEVGVRPEIQELVAETLAADLPRMRARLLKDEREVALHQVIFYPELSHEWIGGNAGPLRLVGLLLVFFLLLWIGHVIAYSNPRVGHRLPMLIPGAVGMPLALGMLVLAIFVAGILWVTGNGYLFSPLRMGYWVHFPYLDLEPALRGTPLIAWLPVAVGLGLHGLGVVRDRRT